MAAKSSTYKDPSLSFVWWIEGDKIAIATTDDDGGTTETAEGKLKAPIIGTSGDYIANGMLISYYAEPDVYSNMTAEIDLDNSLHPALINYVKAKALFDAAAKTDDPNIAQIKLQSANFFMNEYRLMVTRYGTRRRDKTGGTRGIVPESLK